MHEILIDAVYEAKGHKKSRRQILISAQKRLDKLFNKLLPNRPNNDYN